MLGAGDEIGERIGLVLELAVLVPAPTELTAASHVRDGEDDTAFEQLQTRRRERGVDRDLVRAVSIQQRGCGAVAHETMPMDDRDGDARSVGCRSPEAPRLVLFGVVAGHRLTL